MSDSNFHTYDEVLDFLYTQLPMFQKVGAKAYRKDLTNTIKLCEFLGHPEHQFKSVHVAGTNGKGSSSHFLSAIMQSAGYKTGLYTSPHLKSFTERIKVDGAEIGTTAVVDFINKVSPVINEIAPSFFEITVAMAFDYFANQQVDIAIVEVGLGGRLDSTNVIIPEVSLITNISLDHQQWLGDSLPVIAAEKAGIIKENIPAVISQRQKDIALVFEQKANDSSSDIVFASDEYAIALQNDKLLLTGSEDYHFVPQLKGAYQQENLRGVVKVIDILNKRGFNVSNSSLMRGVENVVDLTGIKGRWQVIQENPRVICDVGHNEAGVQLILDQLQDEQFGKLYIIWGAVADKDLEPVLSLLPSKAEYYFCQANIPRAMPAKELKLIGESLGLNGQVIEDVNDALSAALKKASDKDIIFIGGSTFVVAEIEGL